MTDHPNIYAALAVAQGEIKPITKTERADIKSTKGSFSYTYADLATVLASIMPVLHENGIAVTQTTAIADNGAFVLRTTLWHTGGESFIEGDYLIQCRDMSDPQAVGSAVTYARRYALIAMLCLATEDDDGQRAQQTARPSREDTPTPSKQVTMRPNPPTPQMWTVEVAQALMIENDKERKKMLLRLGNESVSWGLPSYIMELRDRAGDESFASWLDATAANAGLNIE